jgi:phosphomannomutase
MELFGTAGIRGPVGERVAPDLALSIGRAVGEDGEEFVLARDGRETGPALAAAIEAGLESAGADVRRAGQLPTPALAYASRGRRGVMITASHNPPPDNGIKLFVDGVEYDREGERRVERRVAEDRPPATWNEWGDAESVDVLESYRQSVADYARETVGSGEQRPLSGLTVAVDCGTGMASVATPQVLGELGATVVGVNASVDGYFPARESKPTPESLTEFRAFLEEGDGKFDLGIAHDGDADRIVILTGSGAVVHEDTILAMLAHHYVTESSAEDPVVVTTPNASGRIDERVSTAGGRVERVRLGALHEGIAEARAAGGDVVFAGEPWKHVHPGFGGWIDGVASAAVVAGLVAAAGGLETLREPIAERPYRKTSVPCPEAAKDGAMDRVATELPAEFPRGEVDTEYGVRIDLPDGAWILVRPSGTEPYVRIYAESDAVDRLVDRARQVVTAAVEAAKE